jgi:hypothetical protein
MMGVEYDILPDGRRIEVETLPSRVAPKRRQRADQFVGCPLEWLRRMLPLVKSKEQLAVAIWLHRQRAICRDEVFTVPNQDLYRELGLDRFTKYRALQCLEEAGAITLVRAGKRALRVRILW